MSNPNRWYIVTIKNELTWVLDKLPPQTIIRGYKAFPIDTGQFPKVEDVRNGKFYPILRNDASLTVEEFKQIFVRREANDNCPRFWMLDINAVDFWAPNNNWLLTSGAVDKDNIYIWEDCPSPARYNSWAEKVGENIRHTATIGYGVDNNHVRRVDEPYLDEGQEVY